MSSATKKIILVIGATGTQGMAVIDGLLASSADGSPSPYVIRALTRNPDHRRAKELAARGVELYKGSASDLNNVQDALQGAYGVYINTDSHVLGEQLEVFLGMRIFEIAKRVKTLRHYVYSSLDYGLKLANYDPHYRVEHYDAKGRVADWMTAQPSDVSDTGLSWTCVNSASYMEMFNFQLFAPMTRRADGTYVFAAPIGDGHVPVISLRDFGFWARYMFDHRESTSAKILHIASDLVGWDYLVETFQKVTGKKAAAVKQTIDEWMACFKDVDAPTSHGGTPGLTFRESFSGWWAVYRDDITKRDLKWIREVHPDGHTLESWMRETGYIGDRSAPQLLKDAEDSGAFALNLGHIEATLYKV